MTQLREWATGLVHLFYPRLCEGCSQPLLAAEDVLCIGCGLQLSVTDYHHMADNETAMRFAGRLPFIHATSLAYFTPDGLLQHLLHGLKYGRKKDTGLYLGRLLGKELLQAGWTGDIDHIIPVPLHGKKEAQRGFNQSMLIATGISEITGIPVADKILARNRNTESQTQKTRSERAANMQDAFTLRNATAIAGSHVLIVDDVLTTGATIEACAMAITAAGNVKISIATIGLAT